MIETYGEANEIYVYQSKFDVFPADLPELPRGVQIISA